MPFNSTIPPLEPLAARAHESVGWSLTLAADPPFWIPVILIVGCGLILAALAAQWLFQRYGPDRTSGRPADPETRRLIQLLEEARASEARLSTFINEIRALTDQVASQLDGHAARLESMITNADERISPPSAPDPTHAARAQTFAPDRPRQAGPSMQPLRRDNDRGTSAFSNRANDHSPDPMAAQVYKLADDGLPPVEIARRLGQHTGKVELILALRRP